MGIVGYLGGFQALFAYLQELYIERKNKKLEAERLKKRERDGSADDDHLADDGPGGGGRFDRQESNETGIDDYRNGGGAGGKGNGAGVIKSGFPTDLQDGEGSDIDEDVRFPHATKKAGGISHEGGG